MLFILLILSFDIVTGVNIKLLSEEKDNKITNIRPCIHEIFDLHKKNYKLTIVIYAKETKEIIPSVVLTEKTPIVITANINDLNKISEIYKGTVLIVITFESCVEIIDLDVIFDIKLRYIIILDTYVKEKCYEVVTKKLYELKTYNVIIITYIKTGQYNLITAIPEMDEVTCDMSKNVTIKLINVCQNGSLNEKEISNIFPAKEITNFKLCNFKVGMATLYPHSIVIQQDSLKDLDTTGHFYGSDVEMMKILAKKCNSTLKLFYINRDKKNSYNLTQLVEHLLDGTLDACAGGLYRVYGDNVTYSGTYSKQSVFWVYTVERDRRSWQSLVVKMTGLYIFLFTYVCYVILWNLLSQFDYQNMSITDSIVYGWGALLGAASLQDARSIKQKILNIMYLIMCLHLSAFVSTQIYYYLIEGPPKQFKTTDEMKSSNRLQYLIPSLKNFIDDKKHKAYVNKSRDCDNFTHCEELILKHKASTILIEGLLPKFQSESSVDDEASVLRVPDDIVVTYHKIVLRTSSPLVKTFQKSIQSLFEAGICKKLYNEAIGITVVDKAKIANKKILSNSYSCTLGCAITLSNSAVAFYVWILGCCISWLIFIFEILIKVPSSITSVDDNLISST